MIKLETENGVAYLLPEPHRFGTIRGVDGKSRPAFFTWAGEFLFALEWGQKFTETRVDETIDPDLHYSFAVHIVDDAYYQLPVPRAS